MLSISPTEESFLGYSASIQGGLETSLTSHESLGPITYAHGAREETTSTQVTLILSTHSEATVKICPGTQDTLSPSPSEQEAIGSTISEQDTLLIFPSLITHKSFTNMLFLEGNSRHFPLTKVIPMHLDSRKHKLSVDPSDKEDYGTSTKVGLASSPPAKKKKSNVTTVPQVIPTPSISV